MFKKEREREREGENKSKNNPRKISMPINFSNFRRNKKEMTLKIICFNTSNHQQSSSMALELANFIISVVISSSTMVIYINLFLCLLLLFF